MTLGHRLRAARKARALTLRGLGMLCDLAPQHLHRYETDAHAPRADVLARLCIALGASADDLLGLRAPQDRDPPADA